MLTKVTSAAMLTLILTATPAQAADFTNAPVIGSVVRWLNARAKRLDHAAKVLECKSAAAKRGVTQQLSAEQIEALKATCK
jgi:sulfur relay (sulfurtransferase) complex TusBCD TusD component (DsrE family)